MRQRWRALSKAPAARTTRTRQHPETASRQNSLKPAVTPRPFTLRNAEDHQAAASLSVVSASAWSPRSCIALFPPVRASRKRDPQCHGPPELQPAQPLSQRFAVKHSSRKSYMSRLSNIRRRARICGRSRCRYFRGLATWTSSHDPKISIS
jgi:hypothetical protein